MLSKSFFLKQIKIFVIFLAIAILSPVILARLGFWGASHAVAPKFQQANEPIKNGNEARSFADAISRATPAVVSIHSTKQLPIDQNALARDPVFRYFFGDLRNQLPPDIQSGIGSGVIVTKDGYILTNNHVINDANEITVKLSDGRSAKAKVIGSDPETDLAILKISLPNISVIGMGDSDALRVGDLVFAIGNPFGVGQTVTHGIVSATHRTDLGINTFENFIQTDAPINPGNSGGALIDVNGNLIGINNAIYTRNGGFQGIGFAIPTSLAKDVMGELIDQGHVTRGWLGITVGRLTDESRKSLNYPKGEGAVIAGIMRGGPAFNAGLRPGDIIISVNNKPVTDSATILRDTAKLKPDTAYPISVIRNGETLDFRVVAGKRPLKKAEPKQDVE